MASAESPLFFIRIARLKRAGTYLGSIPSATRYLFSASAVLDLEASMSARLYSAYLFLGSYLSVSSKCVAALSSCPWACALRPALSSADAFDGFGSGRVGVVFPQPATRAATATPATRADPKRRLVDADRAERMEDSSGECVDASSRSSSAR